MFRICDSFTNSDDDNLSSSDNDPFSSFVFLGKQLMEANTSKPSNMEDLDTYYISTKMVASF